MNYRPRVPQVARPITVSLRTHGGPDDCECVRCEAADEISRLRIELWEAYDQIDVLLNANCVTPIY